MARHWDTATVKTLNFTGAIIPTASAAYSIAAWFRPSGLGVHHTLYCQSDYASANDFFGLELTAANQCGLLSKHAGVTATEAVSSTTVAATGVWHHLAGVASSATLRTAYLDGGGAGTSTTNQIPTGIIHSSIAASTLGPGSTWSVANGDLAEVAVWGVALGTNEIGALAKGCSPLLIRPSGLLGYWPLRNDFVFGQGSVSELWRNNRFTWSAEPVLTDHPPMRYPKRRSFLAVVPNIVTPTAWPAALLPAM